jgi:polyhydroxyalkanoate synthesis repressor PhaR
MPSDRIIKKYPNRRLYDTELSRYITLSDVRELVMTGVPFRVLDTGTDADLTRAILLQIMLEEETGGEPLFSACMLAQIIRFYGGTLHGVFGRYMELSLNAFAEQQKQLLETWGEAPLNALSRLTRRNMDIWAETQDKLLRATGFGPAVNDDKVVSPTPQPNPIPNPNPEHAPSPEPASSLEPDPRRSDKPSQDDAVLEDAISDDAISDDARSRHRR